MARKILVATVKESDLISVRSAIKGELRHLNYTNKVWFENNAFHIQGKPQIQQFVLSMNEIISEARSLFTDDESIATFAQDEEFLGSLLKIKAS